MLIRLVLLSVPILVVVYAAVVLWFRLNEDRIIFEPDRGEAQPPASELGLRSRDVTVHSAGLKLRARLILPPESIPEASAAWLLYLHGSSGSVSLPAYNEAWAEFRNAGLGIFAVDYRGYGESEGATSEAGIYEDALAAYEYLRQELNVPPARILIYGFSMGAAVAIDLATRVEAAGLLLEGAWRSVPRVGAERYPFLPVSLMVRNRFASEDKVAQISMPKLFLHARGDAAIPIAHGRRLFELSREPKAFKELAGEHGTSHKSDLTFFSSVTDFIAARQLPVIRRSDAPKPRP